MKRSKWKRLRAEAGLRRSLYPELVDVTEVYPPGTSTPRYFVSGIEIPRPHVSAEGRGNSLGFARDRLRKCGHPVPPVRG